MTRNTIARRADAFARRTRLSRLTLVDRSEPRNLRWWPLVTLAAMLVGYALVVSIEDLNHAAPWRFVLGASLYFSGFFGAFYIRYIGPRLLPDRDHPLDERETAIRARAGNISFMAIVWLLTMGCFYASVAQPFGWWMPSPPIAWLWLGMMIQGWTNALPVLVASWLQPRLDD